MRRRGFSPRLRLLLYFPAILLPVSFAGKRLLSPELLSRLQIERVSLHFLDDVFLLDFSLEAAEGIFECLALLKLYFSQTQYTSQLDHKFRYAFGICDYGVHLQ